MCLMKRSSWWCHKLFVIPIIIATFMGLITALNMDYRSRNLPVFMEKNYAKNIEFMLEEYKNSGRPIDHYMMHITSVLDTNYGVSAGLYDTSGKELYELNTQPDPDGSPLMTKELKEEIKNNIPYGQTGEVTIYSHLTGRKTTHKIFYVSQGKYTIVYGIRPDYISKYSLDFDSFYWWILGGMVFNIITYLITFSVFRRYQKFYDKRVSNFNYRRDYVSNIRKSKREKQDD